MRLGARTVLRGMAFPEDTVLANHKSNRNDRQIPRVRIPTAGVRWLRVTGHFKCPWEGSILNSSDPWFYWSWIFWPPWLSTHQSGPGGGRTTGKIIIRVQRKCLSTYRFQNAGQSGRNRPKFNDMLRCERGIKISPDLQNAFPQNPFLPTVSSVRSENYSSSPLIQESTKSN